MDIESVRHNERWKAFAAMADNVAVAFIIAAGAEFYHVKHVDTDMAVAAIGTVISMAVAWSLRGEIEPEDDL